MKSGTHRGALSKPVTVTTNDPTQAIVVLNIQAQVQGSVIVLPTAALSFATLAERPGRLLIRKDPTETGVLAVGGTVASLDWLTVTSRKVADGETAIEGVPQPQPGDWLIEVKPLTAPAPGSYQGTLTFETGLPREPKVSVPLMTFVRPPLTVNPAEAVLRGGSEAVLLVAVRPDVDADALRAIAEPPGIDALLERSAQRTFRLHVAWKGDPATRPQTGTITLTSGSQSFRIPVRLEPVPAAGPPTTN